MSILRYATAVVAIALFGVSTGSAAQEDAGFYIGGNFGQSKVKDFDDDCRDVAALVPGVAVDCDDTGTAWKAFAGYQINQHFAAEFGYTDLGEASVSASGPGGTAGIEFEATAFFLQAVGMIPITGGLSVLGRVGAAWWDLEVNGTGLATGFSADDDGFSLAYGAGLQWMFTRNFGLRAEYEIYDSIGDDDTTGEADVHMYSLGAVFRF